MALYPCSQGKHRYPGQQRSVYASVLSGGINGRAKLRLCGSHFFNYLANATELMHEIPTDGEDSDPATGRCLVCGLAIETRSHPVAIVTAYDRDSEPRQFTSPVCEDEVDQAEQMLSLEPVEGQEGSFATDTVSGQPLKKK